MRLKLGMAVAAAALISSSPAFAEACTGTAGSLPYQTTPEYVDCEQYDAINGGNDAAVAAYNVGFDAVGYAGPDLTWAQLEPTKDFFAIINGDQIVFDNALLGQQFFAVHFGSAGGEQGDFNDTLFFQFNFLAPTTMVDLNRMGFSNAIGVLSVPPPVPEPTTWAMTLMGFGAAGYAMRRRRRATALAQLA
jgi:hypothetical protein